MCSVNPSPPPLRLDLLLKIANRIRMMSDAERKRLSEDVEELKRLTAEFKAEGAP